MSHESTVIRSVDENARRQFEAAWRAGRARSIEDYLPPENDPRYLATLEELILIQMEFVWKSRHGGANPPLVEAWLERFLCLDQPAVTLRLVQQEFLLR